MKKIIAAIIILSSVAYGQTNFRTVMVDTNNIVQRPTNFWSANSNSIKSVFPDVIFNRNISYFANLTTETINGSASVTNSIARISISGTNASGKAAIRFMQDVNSLRPAGDGTLFASDSHAFWIRIEAVPRDGTIRAVLGNNSTLTTNIAEYPTNHAIGFELSNAGGDTNQIRIIAHNGTTNTNGPWVNIGTVFNRFWIGVEQNKTNGEAKLYIGLNLSLPTNKTNATILGGPTNNAGANLSAFDVGIFTTNTNAATLSANIYSAFVDVID